MRKKLFPLALGLGLAASVSSCTTMYDAQGNPREVVSPEGAALAAVAAGVIGYAIADNNNDYHHGHRRGYRGGGYGYGGYRGGGRYCR